MLLSGVIFMQTLFAFAGVYIALLLLYISEPRRFPAGWVPKEPGPKVLRFFSLLGQLALVLSVAPFVMHHGWEIGIPVWLLAICLFGLIMVLLLPLRSKWILLSAPVILLCSVSGILV